MATKLKNIKYSWLSKSVSLLLLWTTGAVFLVSAIISYGASYYDLYEPYEGSFLFNEVVVKELIEAVDTSDIFVTDQMRRTVALDGSNSNLLYRVSNTKTGSYVTNTNEKRVNGFFDDPKKYEHRMKITPENAAYYRWVYMLNEEKKSLNDFLEYDEFEITIAIKKDYPLGDEIRRGRDDYVAFKNGVMKARDVFSIASFLLIINLIYIGYIVGYKDSEKQIKMKGIDKISIELMILFGVLFSLVSYIVLAYDFVFSRSNILKILLMLTNYNEMIRVVPFVSFLGAALVYTAYFIICVTIFDSSIRHIKDKSFFSNLISYRLIKRLVNLVVGIVNKVLKVLRHMAGVVIGIYSRSTKNISYVYRLLIKGFVCLALNIFFMFMIVYSGGGNGFFVVLVLADVGYIYFIVAEIGGILDKVKNLSMGNFESFENLESRHGDFSEIYENLIKINGTIQKSVEKALKNERTKTALITNVSHDLKTPLTSIITYVDLLKNEALDNEQAEAYIQVLEAKSEKLKYLIENLIEVSKTSTGNVDVKLEIINIMELLNQSIGEYEAKLNEVGLNIVTNVETKDVFIHADGNIMWRIFDNLFSNISKYSLPNSRVYVNIVATDQEISIIIKNISKNQLNISSDKLLERFVRGDVSRSSEGYGLGLSITEDLVVVQGGEFTIDIDGDLFKTTIKMNKSRGPLVKELVEV